MHVTDTAAITVIAAKKYRKATIKYILAVSAVRCRCASIQVKVTQGSIR